jgi:hypothetical protein
MLSVRADYVLSSYEADVVKPLMCFFYEAAPIAASQLAVLPEQAQSEKSQGVRGTEFPDSVN